MIEYLIAAACGAIAAVAYPPANALAVRLRDWLYGLFRNGSAEAGA